METQVGASQLAKRFSGHVALLCSWVANPVAPCWCGCCSFTGAVRGAAGTGTSAEKPKLLPTSQTRTSQESTY